MKRRDEVTSQALAISRAKGATDMANQNDKTPAAVKAAAASAVNTALTGAVDAPPIVDAPPAPVDPAPVAASVGATDAPPAPAADAAPDAALPAPSSPAAPAGSIPPPPGRSPLATSGAPAATSAGSVDNAARVADLAAQILPTLRDSLADALGVAKAVVDVGAQYFAPLIAQQAINETSDDPDTRTRAVANRRHLNGQFLMTAATKGIPLEQRQEQKAIGVVMALVNIAVRFATGGVA